MALFDFFKIVYDEVFVLQLIAVSFSVVWVFYDWERQTKILRSGLRTSQVYLQSARC